MFLYLGLKAETPSKKREPNTPRAIFERHRFSRCLKILVKAIRVRVRNPQSLVYAARIIFTGLL
jgi:hypothetical protein